MFVVGISGTKPKTRAFVTERTWADHTKSAFSDGTVLSSTKAVPQSAQLSELARAAIQINARLTYLCA